jgi:hypothetical protein
MKIKPSFPNRSRGYIIIMVMIMCAASLLILTGVLNFTYTTANLNMRSNQLSLLQNAAEAATEKVYARISYDFNAYGPGQVNSNYVQGIYHQITPTSSDNPYFSQFNFSDTTNNGFTYVQLLTNYTGTLPTQYTNSFATTSPIYRIVSNVTSPNSYASGVIGTAQEDVLLALLPITTYAIFYNGELEFSDCATMTVSGRTHSNADICTGSASDLTFNGAVTCCSIIQSPERGGISYSPVNENVTYNSGSSTDVVSVQISIPMTNTISIIQMPPSGEAYGSLIGQQREYNKAQVVLVISNSTYANPAAWLTLQTASSGGLPAGDGSAEHFAYTNASPGLLQTNFNWYVSGCLTNSIALPFLSLTNTFTDLRQFKTNMFVTQIDIGAFRQWALTNSVVVGKMNSTNQEYPTILYVADMRATNNYQMSVVRLVNAQELPNNNGNGFSVATANPLYVKGDYNTTQNFTNFATSIGSTTNGYTVSSALFSDSITLLSSNWSDALSATNLPNRKLPWNMTLNAAIITGNVPSTGTSASTFSGGVHNLTRYLENWSGYTTTYNTSIVCLFASAISTNQFQMPYSSSSNPTGYYVPPTRNWGYDPTFYSPNKQPPGVPEALVPIRFNWIQPPPGSVTTGLN